ncbi:lipopolysaccharide-induced tumor necrosis factor-alpha factor homolog [Drosophila innubila]|uniref:lipopolysaccharide-induced tumor necrosis factor-alpha factor homolog n=1 Tax=Drosophila innubila TaxID=198719 RepID=UPI00148E3BA6|nr:lipopolysaccharide-induced tumor necrosis factor-alpha factor homolog [Drosophila innubila]
MEYSKLPPQPPAYSPQNHGTWNAAASAPPTELIHAAPTPIYPQRPTVDPVNVVHQNTIIIESQGQGGPGMTCPQCRARVKMRVEHHATGKTYLLAALLCLFLCWPCVCVPCCCNCCYKTSQFCPNCNACLGSF